VRFFPSRERPLVPFQVFWPDSLPEAARPAKARLRLGLAGTIWDRTRERGNDSCKRPSAPRWFYPRVPADSDGTVALAPRRRDAPELPKESSKAAIACSLDGARYLQVLSFQYGGIGIYPARTNSE
jgi:hypothetical protein